MADREAIIKKCQECIDSGEPAMDYSFYYDVIRLLKEQPEQKHGHWIISGKPPLMIKKCSECNIRIFHHSGNELEKFCAWCGAKMDGEVMQDE